MPGALEGRKGLEELSQNEHFAHMLRFRKAVAEGTSRKLYSGIVSSYTGREISDDSDALRVVSALFSVLQDSYFDRGFHYGLPVRFIRSALCWSPKCAASSTRRRCMPSWSWAGWRGAASLILAEKLYPPQPSLTV